MENSNYNPLPKESAEPMSLFERITSSSLTKLFVIFVLVIITLIPMSLIDDLVSDENWKPDYDGSIGVRLISRYNFTVNLLQGEIFFSPNILYNFPQDFVLADYLFGWDYLGKLRVLGNIKSPTKNQFSATDEVLVLNGITVNEIVKDANIIKDLILKAKDSGIKVKTNKQEVDLSAQG